MIELILKGGFGNHLMTYFLACILADKYKDFDFILNIQSINNSKELDTQTTIYKIIKNINLINNSDKNYKNIINIINPECYLNIYNNYYDKYDKYDKYIINLIHINDMDFYLKNINVIKKYLTFNKIENNNNSIVLSLRLGLCKNEVVVPSPYENVLRLPFEYYKKSIEYFREKNNSIDNLIICCDDFNNEFLENFKKNIEGVNITLYNKNTLEQFELLINAKNFISSNSSFSLLAILFNDYNIIYPIFSDSNSPMPGIENTRYNKILNVEKENCYKMIIKK